MKNVSDYINDHENWIETSDLEILVESDDFNDLDDKSKSEIFYMTSFDMSSKEYNKLQEAIEDFELIIKCINYNNYLQKSHECFETLITNYLDIIDNLLKPAYKSYKKEQEIFIKYLHKFLQSLEELHYPNKNCKAGIIKALINIQDSLSSFKKGIQQQNIKKFKRYCSELDSYIEEQGKDININDNNINDINIDNDNKNNESIKSYENSYENNSIKNKNEFSHDKYMKNDNKQEINTDNINIIKDKINPIENSISENVYLNKPIKNEIINDKNNDLVQNNINNFMDLNKSLILSENSSNFEIINNESRIYENNNSLNDSKKYYESINPNYSVSAQIKELVESKNKMEEEEKVKVINEEIINFIGEIYPIFAIKNFNKEEEEKFSFLKKRYLKSENIIENNFNNNSNNISSNINFNNQNNPNKKKKKGKKKKKNKSMNEK